MNIWKYEYKNMNEKTNKYTWPNKWIKFKFQIITGWGWSHSQIKILPSQLVVHTSFSSYRLKSTADTNSVCWACLNFKGSTGSLKS